MLPTWQSRGVRFQYLYWPYFREHCTSASTGARQACGSSCDGRQGLTSPHTHLPHPRPSRPVSEVELDRAKRAAVSIIYNALESKATSTDDIGRQFLTYGKRWAGWGGQAGGGRPGWFVGG